MIICKTTAEKYVFPRIPIRMEVPEGMPDIDRINSMAVVPVLDRYVVHSGELELWGGYRLKVFYKPAAGAKKPLYSWDLNKKFHTYAEFNGTGQGKRVWIQPTVEKIDLEVTNPRTVRGALTVALDIRKG